MSEKEVKIEVLKQLGNDFIFIPEAKGKHFTGKRLSIDYIMRPKDTTLWKNKKIAFGVEFKDLPRLDSEGNTNDFTKWLGQCVDYAHTNWDDYGYLYILTCPGITSSKFVNAIDKDRLTGRILGHLGIGELRLSNYHGWTIYLQEQCRIWSQDDGVTTEGRCWNLIRKFGSR